MLERLIKKNQWIEKRKKGEHEQDIGLHQVAVKLRRTQMKLSESFVFLIIITGR